MNAQILLVFRIGEAGQGRLAADIMDGRPDRFLGEVCFGQITDFQQAAELFGGEFVYPKDLDSHGFQTGQSVAGRAKLWYRVSDGSFGLAVRFMQDWQGSYGAGSFGVESITGRAEYLGKASGQYLFGLEGKFILGQYRANLSLSLSSGQTDIPTALALEFEKRKEGTDFPGLIDFVSEKGSYEGLPVPEDYGKPEKAFDLKAVLNLTEQTFLVSGSYQTKSGAKAAVVFLITGQKEWWLAAQLKQFSLSDISSALEGADRFLGLKNVTAAVVLSSARQKIHAVEGEPFFGEIEEVNRGLTFQIELDLCDGFLKEALDIQGICRVSGYIPADKEQEIKLSGRAERMVFLQFLTLSDLEVVFRKHTQQKQFFFWMGGSLQLAFPELPMPQIRAEISLQEDQESKKLELQGRVGEPVENPLGIRNTKLEQLVFHAVFESFEVQDTVEKREQFYFQGKVVIAAVEIMAAIYFAQRRPAVVEMRIGGEKRISVSGLVEKYFQFKWPDLLDIQLYNGRIWYCHQEAAVGQTVYQAGFHAQVDTKIFFLPEFTLSVDIGSGEQFSTGARMKQAAELAFLKFYLIEDKEEYGPRVTIQVAEGKTLFQIHTRVAFFSKEIGEVEITVGKSRMEGIFRFPDNLPITGQIGFCADEKGVSLAECEIGRLPKMDFDLPEMEFGSGKCKIKILGDIKFKTVPEVKSTEFILDEDKLGAKFNLTIRIKSETSFSEDGGDDLVSLPFKNLSVSARKDEFSNFTFDTFMEILGDNIASLVTAMGQQIINGEVFDDILTKEGMENLAKFLTIAGLTWGINELVSFLICKGLKKALAGAFAAALTGATQSMWEGLGFFLALGGILGTIDSHGRYTVKKKAPKKNKKEPAKNPQTPDGPELSFRDEKLLIKWKACKGAEGYYPVVVRKCPGQPEEETNLVVNGCEKASCEITGSDAVSLYLASYGFEYRVRIYAWNEEGCALGEETAIYLLTRPGNMRIRYRCETRSLSLSWDQVDKAGQYEVERLWHEQSGIRREVVTYESGVGEAVYEDQEAEQTIEVFVRGKAPAVSGPAAGSGKFYLYDLKPPEEMDGYDTDDGIMLKWAQVPYADRYRVSCLDSAGREIESSVCRQTQTVIKAEKLQDNVCYRMRIQPMTQEIEGWTSGEAEVLWRLLPVPEIREFVCGEDGLLFVVLNAGGLTYRQTVYPDGSVVVLDEQSVSCQWEIKEEAKVRVVDRARQGKWSQPVCTKPLRTPSGIQAAVEEDTLSVQWDKTGEECLYGLEIVAGDGRRVEEMITETKWQMDLSGIPEDEVIRVCLYAIDKADPRRRSVSAEVSCERSK